MNWRDTFRTAGEAVRTHRLRSALTMLGILIGISAVVLTVGLGAGRQGRGARQHQRARHQPARDLAGQHDRRSTGRPRRLRLGVDADPPGRRRAGVDRRRARHPGRAPASSTTTASLRAGTTNWTTTLTGTTASWQDVRSRDASTPGRFLTDADDSRRPPSSCSGPTPPPSCSAPPTPSARRSPTTASTLEVVGVLAGAQLVGGDQQQRHRHRARHAPTPSGSSAAPAATRSASIYVKATSSDTLSAAYQEADALLLNRHGITAAANADFSIATQQSILSAATTGRRHDDGDARPASPSSRCSSAASA